MGAKIRGTAPREGNIRPRAGGKPSVEEYPPQGEMGGDGGVTLYRWKEGPVGRELLLEEPTGETGGEGPCGLHARGCGHECQGTPAAEILPCAHRCRSRF